METIVIKWSNDKNAMSGPIDCEICCSEDVQPKDQTCCSNNHKFCRDCAKSMAQVQIITNLQANLPCMSMEGCDAEFEEEEVKKFLPYILYKKWKDLQMESFAKELEIEGSLEHCPFCDFNRMVIDEVESKTTFICENQNCGRWSCRKCKFDDHSPISCEEAERILMDVEDQKNKFIFEATVRRCPKCGIAIDKIEGCNKMTCKKCGTPFCYLCKKNISVEGYGHFSGSSTCQIHQCSKTIIEKERIAAEKRFDDIYMGKDFIEEREQALYDAIEQAREKENARLLQQDEHVGGYG